jgi:hypothetical protein
MACNYWKKAVVFLLLWEQSTVALCTVYQDVMGSVLAIFGDPGLQTKPKSLCYVWVYVHLWTVTVVELTVFSYEVTVQ